MMEIAVAGATGRMGRAVLEAVGCDDGLTVSAALTRSEDPLCGSSIRVGDAEIAIVDKLGTSCEVMIDFSTAQGTVEWLEVCTRFEIPMVIGTTGHSAEQDERIAAGARLIPIVRASNFSVGLQLVLELASLVAKTLDESYDIEVVETHHRDKVDAPSGTALSIVERLLEARGWSYDQHVRLGRSGDTGPRPSKQIGVHSVRLGDVVGRHEIHVGGADETITIGHSVQSRRAFALGALRAAKWIVGRDPGLYTMRDVLGV